MHVRIAAPVGFQPDPGVVARAERLAKESGGSVLVTDSAAEAARDSDVLATDTWVSMGQEDDERERETIFAPYRLSTKRLQDAASGAVVLHCLPAYRGKEIDAEVLDGPQSVVWDEAENRRHVQKAILIFLLDNGSFPEPVEGGPSIGSGNAS